ncbi:Mu-like protein prophage major head subunit gpT-like protein [Elusimicrobium minutum Pei191]|uniref:Mu-like protein prophage major head subunit gpT-like protein n=1 Tax=Elusimicrobium minutum (strain Pei191) TaxID=445932 RepID=B2KDA9_ELUMP|nr:Mu-like prophage major head subunit gpT family protein [Elusimicrobium minutum]ACC98505.1 Mu-like protein prophage major head subunit gpT-like protein [Elusimicrobium minutum Pei191]
MAITQEQLDALNIAAQGKFQQAIEKYDMGFLGQLALSVTSTHASETYTGLNQLPDLDKFIDEVKYTQILGKSHMIENEEFAGGVTIQSKDVEDDNLGLFPSRISDLGTVAANKPLRQVIKMLENGNNSSMGIAYDGSNFFATDHKDGKASYSNLLTGSGTTASQFEADFTKAVAALKRLPNDAGNPFYGDLSVSAANLLVVVPTELEIVAQKVLTTTFGANGADNVLKNRAQIASPALLTDPNDWYLVFTGSSMKPIIHQNRKAPEIVLPTLNDESYKKHLKLEYMANTRFGTGWAFPQLALKIVNG